MEVAHLPLLHKTSGRQWGLLANLFHTHTRTLTRRTAVLDVAEPSNQQLSQLGEHRGGAVVVVVVGSKMQLEGGMKGCKIGWGRVEAGRRVTS